MHQLGGSDVFCPPSLRYGKLGCFGLRSRLVLCDVVPPGLLAASLDSSTNEFGTQAFWGHGDTDGRTASQHAVGDRFCCLVKKFSTSYKQGCVQGLRFPKRLQQWTCMTTLIEAILLLHRPVPEALSLLPWLRQADVQEASCTRVQART